MVHKLIISGLFANATNADVLQRFGFGNASKVKIKTHVDSEGNTGKKAVLKFRSLDVLKKCVSVFNNSRWKGSILSLKLDDRPTKTDKKPEKISNCVLKMQKYAEISEIDLNSFSTAPAGNRVKSLERGDGHRIEFKPPPQSLVDNDIDFDIVPVGDVGEGLRVGHYYDDDDDDDDDGFVSKDSRTGDISGLKRKVANMDLDEETRGHKSRKLARNADVSENVEEETKFVSKRERRQSCKHEGNIGKDAGSVHSEVTHDGSLLRRKSKVTSALERGKKLKRKLDKERGGCIDEATDVARTKMGGTKSEHNAENENDDNETSEQLSETVTDAEKPTDRIADNVDVTEDSVQKGDKSVRNLTTVQRHQLSNEIRQKSMASRRQGRESERAVVQKCLRGETVAQNKKIMFDGSSSDDESTLISDRNNTTSYGNVTKFDPWISSDEDGESRVPTENSQNYKSTTENSQTYNSSTEVKDDSRSNVKLFNDSSDDEDDSNYDDRFEVKPQFKGEHGHKLLEIQSQIAHDARFAIDERFADSDHESDNNDDSPKETQEDDERTRSLKILGSVVGESSVVRPQKKEKHKVYDMVRYDPDNDDHKKYEKPIVPKPAKLNIDVEKVTPMREIIPTVTKKQFYNVDTTIQIATGKDNSDQAQFCLSDLFGVVEVEKEEAKKPWKPEPRLNPLVDDVTKKTQSGMRSTKPVAVKVSRPSFFYKLDDPEVKEGLQFFCHKKPQKEIESEWHKGRSLLLESNRIRQRRYSNSCHRKRDDGSDKYLEYKPTKGRTRGKR